MLRGHFCSALCIYIKLRCFNCAAVRKGLFIPEGIDSGNDTVVGMAAGDSSITPQQLEYEQQLQAHGYTAEQARAYADQHFRPWLNQ